MKHNLTFWKYTTWQNSMFGTRWQIMNAWLFCCHHTPHSDDCVRWVISCTMFSRISSWCSQGSCSLSKKKSINPLADVIFSSSWHLFNTWKSEFKKKKEQCGLCRSWLFLTFIWQILTQRWCLIRLDFASLSKQDAFDETLFGISSANPFLETHLCGNKEHWTMLTGVTEEMTFQNGCININPQLKATVMGNSHAKREWWNYGSSFLYCEGKLITASNI